MRAVGSGCHFLQQFPQEVRANIRRPLVDLLPSAVDMMPLALAKIERQEVQLPQDIQPVYVRDRISWKKLAEQGKAV